MNMIEGQGRATFFCRGVVACAMPASSRCKSKDIRLSVSGSEGEGERRWC